jgi:hypothetical protein
MERVFRGDESLPTQAVLVLAQRDKARLSAADAESGTRTDFVQRQLKQADELYRSGKTQDAREKWQSVVKLYGGKPEFEPLVKQAESRLQNPSQALEAAEDQAPAAPE